MSQNIRLSWCVGMGIRLMVLRLKVLCIVLYTPRSMLLFRQMLWRWRARLAWNLSLSLSRWRRRCVRGVLRWTKALKINPGSFGVWRSRRPDCMLTKAEAEASIKSWEKILRITNYVNSLGIDITKLTPWSLRYAQLYPVWAQMPNLGPLLNYS